MALEPNRSWVVHGDNLDLLKRLGDGVARLVYIDPPFNTGADRSRTELAVEASAEGDRIGFGGRRYATSELGTLAYGDSFESSATYLSFLTPRLEEARRILTDDGTLYFHIDYRESHYCRLLLDEIFGRDHFLNEIIWAYDFGGRSRRRWPAKHDTILVYVKNQRDYFFDQDAVDRIPYMAPGLVGPDKAARGKTPTDVWWHTIVGTNSREKTGYPTQKPEGLVRRVVQASSQTGDLVVDFFVGSGTTGAVCQQLGRRFILVDNNLDAIKVMRTRIPEATFIEMPGGID